MAKYTLSAAAHNGFGDFTTVVVSVTDTLGQPVTKLKKASFSFSNVVHLTQGNELGAQVVHYFEEHPNGYYFIIIKADPNSRRSRGTFTGDPLTITVRKINTRVTVGGGSGQVLDSEGYLVIPVL